MFLDPAELTLGKIQHKLPILFQYIHATRQKKFPAAYNSQEAVIGVRDLPRARAAVC